MDDFSLGTVVAEDFDYANKLAYSASGGALVRLPNTLVTHPLSNNYDPGVDQIVFMSFDKDEGVLGAEKALIAILFQDWKMPRAAIGHLFDPRPIQGFFDVFAESIHCCWYHVPVERLDNATGKLKYSMLHIWQVWEAEKSHVRVLVLYPPFMKADFIAVMPSFFKATTGHNCFRWPQFLLILIKTAIETWKKTRWVTMSVGSIVVWPIKVASARE